MTTGAWAEAGCRMDVFPINVLAGSRTFRGVPCFYPAGKPDGAASGGSKKDPLRLTG